MQIENGRFYFISNIFIQKYGIKYNLMENKETGTKRPCYFCFKDKTDENIIWFVPISKQYEKYKSIYEKKKQKIHREPLNFVFGIVKDENAVFLIQNMFPTTQKYIEEKYQVKNNDVTISMPLQKEIIEKAESVLRLEEKGIHVSFSDLIDFKRELLDKQKSSEHSKKIYYFNLNNLISINLNINKWVDILLLYKIYLPKIYQNVRIFGILLVKYFQKFEAFWVLNPLYIK